MNDPDENPWSDAPPTGAQNSWPAKRQTPPDLGSLSLAPSAHQQSPQQSDIWNLDQADWATQPSTNAQAVGASTFASSNQTSSAPQSSTEVSVQTQTEPTEMLQTPQRESKPQPPTTTTVPENFSTPKHIPSLSLSSLKNVFTAAQSGSLGTPPILTPASVNAEAGPSSATKDTFSTTPSAANLDGNTGQLQSVPNTPTKTSDPPFDFKRFQQQMASRAATPLAKDARGFLKEFRKKRLSVPDQIKAINDFLDDIATKMRNNEIWANASEKEFDNAVEAMEKQIMNSLYSQTFTPAVADQVPAVNILTDDLDKDQVLTQRIKLFSWVKEEHLDLPSPEEPTPRRDEVVQIKDLTPYNQYMIRAQNELLDVSRFKSPRDKLITLLNTCKLIFMLIRNTFDEASGADAFIPYLILVILRANPPHLISNIQYIQRFRNPERLQGEAGYYLSSLNGAIAFIESMDHSSLSNISQDEFEHQLEQAVSDLQMAEQQAEGSRLRAIAQEGPANSGTSTPTKVEDQDAAAARPLSTAAKDSMDFIMRSSDYAQRTMSKPVFAIQKILKDLGDQPVESQRAQVSSSSSHSPEQMRRRGYGPSYVPTSPTTGAIEAQQRRRPMHLEHQPSDFLPDSTTPEAIQARFDRDAAGQRAATLTTLGSMFPQTDPEVREMVLNSCNNDLARSVDVLISRKQLEMGG